MDMREEMVLPQLSVREPDACPDIHQDSTANMTTVKTLSAALEDGDHIECIIREVCVNQDGATSGITMPSAKAQAALIRQTYTKAGLDYLGDGRPQYVEAHGTGTPAGDPIEAEALSTAFFPDGRPLAQGEGAKQQPIYVGSVKTVLGHTEGTAGVAALIKASLAVRHGVIPPNMLFNHLNPNIQPFYHSLEVPTSPIEWPALPGGQPRRASINSFGFGGANAHAVVESYIPQTHSSLESESAQEPSLPLGPYVFSAASEQSLVANLDAYSTYLAGLDATTLNPCDLAWTLRQRRSTLPVKVAFPAGSIEQLKISIDEKLEEAKSKKTVLGLRSSLLQNKARLLAVFTGQGAQYARMGVELLNRSPLARQIISELEAHLAALPEWERPSWSLEQELRATQATSRLNEAALSQPLCTALQIVQVDLLRAAGVELAGAVGHSSGEIAAAYAASLLSARDAMLVAYFRGLHASSSASPNGADVQGAMMAVGTSMEDAADIVAEFDGAVTLAACNSSASVTLSGDEDAIDELATIFEDEKKFRRKLKVDKAYHSSHMVPCSAPYIKSLRGNDIRVRTPNGSKGPVWYSTVYEDLEMSSPEALAKLQDGSYWCDNMIRPVLFYQGLNKALASGTFDLALEIGPHPALKGPATQTIQETLNTEIPYHGMLVRGTAADVAFSTALGFLWSQETTALSLVNLESFEAAAAGKSDGYHLLKGLPTYQWNHERTYWRESRHSRRLRTRKARVNAILGAVEPESSTTQQRWRNILREREIPWLPGHQLQGRTVFPAAGYVSTLIEAVRQLPQVGGSTIRLIDISNFRILQAMSFGEDDSGIEILSTLENIRKDDEHQSIQAHFTYSSASGRDPDTFVLTASADVEILLGEPSKSLLPARQADPPNLVDVTDDRFYGTLTDLGYGYTGPFRALSSLRRKLGKAVAQVAIPPSDASALLVHPGTLDGAIQAVLLAFCDPGDGQLWSLHVPTLMERIRVNPSLCGVGWGEVESVHVAATMSEADGPGMVGDVDIFAAPSGKDGPVEHAAIQVEGVRTVPFAGATAADDNKIFAGMHWANGSPDGNAMAFDAETMLLERDLVQAAERAAVFYLRKFERDLVPDHPARSHPTYSNYLAFGRHMDGLRAQGRSSYKHAHKKWADDTLEDVLSASEPFKDCIDVRIIDKVGEVMSRIFDGEDIVPEEAIPAELLAEYYVNAVGLRHSGQWLGRGVKQLAHRYPNMNILEVGAGTGAATGRILTHLGAQGFSSYTYTDISADFFKEAASIFAPHKKRMTFKTLDVTRDPVSQGYTPGSYDLVVASAVIHATPRLEQTLRNLRRLLCPGGFLIVNESTSSAFARDGFVFGTMTGWWLGAEEGRTLSPLVEPEYWDEALRNSGFSGIDTITPDAFQDTHSNAVFVSQAIDDTVLFLREPLSAPVPTTVYAGGDGASLEDLVIIGGSTLRTGRAVSDLKRVLRAHVSGSITFFKSLLDLPADFKPSPDTCVLNISELDVPVFEDLTAAGFEALKRLVAVEHTILWVTRGKLSGDPAASMSVGFLRTATHEVPGLRVQCVDLDPGAGNGRVDASVLAETLLRFRHLTRIQNSLDAPPPLWSVELEIAVDTEGRQLVSRYLPDNDANDRFNSARRTITRELDVREAAAVVEKDKTGGYQVVEASLLQHADKLASESGRSATELRATSAIISPVNTPLGPLFLTLGLEDDGSIISGNQKSAGSRRFLALAESLASRCSIPSSATALLSQQDDAASSSRSSVDEKLLALVAANLFAESALQGLVPGQKVAFHNVSGGLAGVLGRRTAEQGLNAIFTTSAEATSENDAISILAFMPAREIRSLLPRDLARFVVASPKDPVAKRIAEVLPVNCRVEHLTAFQGKDLYAAVSPYRSAAEITHEILGDTLRRALNYAQEDLKTSVDVSVNIVSTSDLTSAAQLKAENRDTGSTLQDPLAVLDWQAAPIVQARVSRLDTKPIFKADRTYWLVGLSGALGLSICDWMIAKGAKYIVITSRSPNVNASWQESCRKKDAVVKIFAK
jgi:hybrid polyketide synthase/nonribosomal peptide synthetase ACE1